MYYTERTTSVNARRVVEFSKHSDGEPEKYVCSIADWDAGERADLEAEGIRTIQADKDIITGIQRVREVLGNVDPSRGFVVRPTFYIFQNTLVEYDPKIKINLETGERNNNPACLKEELLTYSWKTTQNGMIKEEPEDKYNHSIDPLRYFFNTLKKVQWRDIEFLSIH